MKTQTTDQHAEAIGFWSRRSSNACAFTPVRSVHRTAIVFATMLLATSFLPRQECNRSTIHSVSSRTAGQNVIGAELPVVLAKSIDSKKLKAGDEVDAKTAAILHLTDGTVISRGAKVVGHVTQAKARSSGDAESALGIVFDKINLPDGRIWQSPLLFGRWPDPNAGVDTGGGISYGGLNEMTEKSAMSQSTQPSVPLLNEQSVGVLGIKNLRLGADGVLTSDQKTVKLDSGMQIMVQAQIVGSRGLRLAYGASMRAGRPGAARRSDFTEHFRRGPGIPVSG